MPPFDASIGLLEYIGWPLSRRDLGKGSVKKIKHPLMMMSMHPCKIDSHDSHFNLIKLGFI